MIMKTVVNTFLAQDVRTMNSKNGWPVIKKLLHFSFNTCLVQ